MMQKYAVDVQTINYLDQEIPILVKTNGKVYIINEILKEEPNFVFNGGGVGKGNSYGHPTQEVLDRLQARGIPVYRTDENGTISRYQ